MNNARQNVQCTAQDLENAKRHLQSALTTVEKDENRTQIQSAMSAIDNAINSVQSTISNYTESRK